MLLFTRGIPVIFYGTEIGIEGGKKHGELRQPFPVDLKVTKEMLLRQKIEQMNENEIFNYLQTLLKLRKQYPALSRGKLTHIYSGDNLYYLIKTFEDERILLLLNTGEENIPFYPAVLRMIMKDASIIKNLINR